MISNQEDFLKNIRKACIAWLLSITFCIISIATDNTIWLLPAQFALGVGCGIMIK